jgi:hypothetical protein
MKWLSNLLPFNWFFTKIKESMVDHLGKPSATRINGYILTVLLSIAVIACLGIEIASAMSAIQTEGGTYSISGQLIALITLLMGHHALLFQLKRKSEETSFPTLDNLNELNAQAGVEIVEDEMEDEIYDDEELNG